VSTKRNVSGWVTFTAYVDVEVDDPEGVEPDHLTNWHHDNFPGVVWGCIHELPGIEFEWKDSDLELTPDPEGDEAGG